MATRRTGVDVQGLRDAIDDVFGHWKQTMGMPRARLDQHREQAIARALRCGYTLEDLRLAVEGCKASAWHSGKNDRNRVYNDIELICRDAKHVDQFISIAEDATRRREAEQRRREAQNEPAFVSRGEDQRERVWKVLKGARR